MKTIRNILVCVAIAGCGGSSNSPDAAHSGFVSIVVKKNVFAVKGVAANVATVKNVRVRISGDGFETMDQTISPDATDVVIPGIPVGENRTITVTTENSDGTAIEEAITTGVKIEGGKTTALEMILEALPVFVNLKENAAVDNDRVVFKVFSASRDPIQISQDDAILVDVSLSLPDVTPDETGLAELYAGPLVSGAHQFTAENLRNGKKTKVSLMLVDAKGKKGAPMFSGGNGQGVVGRSSGKGR